MKKEFSIMSKNSNYSTVRFIGSERHEIFGAMNRDKSIEDGLVIFITPEQHRGNGSIHLSPAKWEWLKELAEKTWIEYYHKTKEDFSLRYGRNYI